LFFPPRSLPFHLIMQLPLDFVCMETNLLQLYSTVEPRTSNGLILEQL
jgi:hypothetical protein